MVAVRAASGSAGLKTQIAQIEKRILDRQQLIRHHVAARRQDLWNSLTSPTVLFSAGGIGFVIGTLARRDSAGARDSPAAGLPSRETPRWPFEMHRNDSYIASHVTLRCQLAVPT